MPLRRKIAAAGTMAVATAGAAVTFVSTTAPEAEAHGSTQVPASRAYTCRFEQPDNPMCARAWAADAQALYDWMEVNIGDADGRHQELIPDGQLCSAGRAKYAAFDEPGEWPVTHLAPNASGEHELVYTNTAPHATAYYRLMLTRPGFDARTDRLTWDDLEVVYESGPLDRAEQNRFTVALPERDQPAILYVIWQRSDSPEAFYSCSDVTITGPGDGSAGPPTTATPPVPPTAAPPGPAPTPTTAPSDPTTTTTAPPAPPAPPATPGPTEPPAAGPDGPAATTEGIEASATVTADWEGGYCVEIRVDNRSSSPAGWEVRYQPDGTVDTLWNAEVDDRDDGQGEVLTFTGEGWNERIAAGRWTTFGMCVSRG